MDFSRISLKIICKLVLFHPYSIHNHLFFFPFHRRESKLSIILFETYCTIQRVCGINGWAKVPEELDDLISEFILKNWNTQSVELRVSLVLYFRLQMRLHCSYDGEVQMFGKVKEIFLEILNYLNQKKVTKLTFNKEERQRPIQLENSERDWLDMAADVFAVISKTNSNSISTSQGSENNNNEMTSTQAAKKRKISTNVWEEFQNTFADISANPQGLLTW